MNRSASSPRFVKAKTAAGLEGAMLKNNIKRHCWHNYQIVHDGAYWFAWYIPEKLDDKDIQEVLSGAIQPDNTR